MYRRAAPAVALASATGIALRGFHSKSNNSTASSTAAMGVANVAAMPAGAPGDQKRLSFRRRQMEKLRDDRSDRAAGHDDRPFGAERTTRSDRDRRRKRFQNRQPRLHFASVDQNGFERFGNSVASNALGAVARHQPDHEAARYGNQHREPAEMVSRRRHKRGTHSAVVKDVCEESDQSQQRPGDERAQKPDADGEKEIGITRAVVVKSPSRSELSLAGSYAAVLLWRSTEFKARASSGPERSSSVRCANASRRRIARPAGVNRTRLRACLRVRSLLATAPVPSRRFTSSTALWCWINSRAAISRIVGFAPSGSP